MNTRNLYQKINAVMLEVERVIKDAKINAGQGSYMAVSHDTVTAALHKPLAKNGIVLKVSQVESSVTDFEHIKEWNGRQTVSKMYRFDVKVELTLINADNPSERETSFFSAYALDSSDKATGKALSMAVKNGLLKLFMLESYDKEEDRIEAETGYIQPKAAPRPHVNSGPAVGKQEVKRNEPEAPKANPKIRNEAPIDLSAAANLVTRLTAAGKENDKFYQWMNTTYGVRMPQQLKVWQYEEILEMLDRNLNK